MNNVRDTASSHLADTPDPRLPLTGASINQREAVLRPEQRYFACVMDTDPKAWPVMFTNSESA